MSDREKNGLRGPVARVRTENFDCDQQTGEVSAQPRNATISAYDPDGRITSNTFVNPDGSTSTTTFSYNSRGDLAETTYEWAGKPGGGTIHHYDEDGKLQRVTGRAPDGSERETSRYTYDPDGGRTEVKFGASASEIAAWVATVKASARDSNSEVGFATFLPPTTTIRYDAEGHSLEELTHDDNHVLTGRTIHTYNDQGLLIETRREPGHKPPMALPPNDPSLEPLEREIVEKVIQNLFQPGAELDRTTYAYDGQGRKIEEVTHSQPFSHIRSTFEYDEHGNETVVRSVHESRDFQATISGELVNPTPPKRTTSTNLIRYTYDAHGNWTEKVHLFVEPSTGEPKPHMVERRAITYW